MAVEVGGLRFSQFSSKLYFKACVTMGLVYQVKPPGGQWCARSYCGVHCFLNAFCIALFKLT